MEGKKLYIPKFIPIYTDIRDNYKLNLRDCQMYGFIKFYIESTANEFFFPDEDLKKILAMKSRTQIWESIKNLELKGLIKVRNTVEVINGTIIKNRFITLVPLPMFGKPNIALFGKPNINNNINNNINKENNSKQKELFDDKTPDDGLTIGW